MLRLLMTLTALACGVGLFAGDVRADVKVRLGFPVQVHTANVMLLRDRMKTSGIDLDATVMRGYPNIQLALTTNELDMAVLGFVNIGLMEEKGFRGSKVIAGVFSGAQSLTLRNGVIAKTWKDLEGRKIGTAPNSYADLLFKSSARLGGADLAKINLVSFAPPGGTPVFVALSAGDIDGFVFWEPNNAEAALRGIGSYSSLDIGANPTGHINGALAVNAEFAAKNHAAVAAVVKALVEATDALNADTALFAQVAQRGTGASPEVVRESLPHGKLDYRLRRKEAKALMQMIHDAGITSIDATPAVDRVFDYSFLEQATGKSRRDLGDE
ncbi:MAG TPA: ABC transporter substrate-binding protein [Xanthobacteraceae bacterium]|jgi:ABC-type nitrate/sulfonate/bicarbonate transport system substrate-binding protein